MITFKEHKTAGYPGRTIENAQADVTLAYAFNFLTSGEKLTRNAVEAAGKLYFPLMADHLPPDVMEQVGSVIGLGETKTINIAGNALDTCLKFNNRYSQQVIDTTVYITLNVILRIAYPNGFPKDLQIQSGGQSGFDEAGLKAAVLMGIPALCIAPKGWMFKDAAGRTIKDEQQFKDRFKQVYQLKEIFG